MKEQDLMKNEYATKDLYFAAFLQVKGVTIKKLEQYGGTGRGWNPVYFIFDNRKRCEELESVLWSGVGDDAVVNIKDYLTTLRDLKARISSVANLVKRERDSFGEADDRYR